MSWWAADPFSAAVDKATSELLPSGTEDIALNLDIADQIKSKSVAAKHAMQVLKRRISHKNPNVVLLTLGLTDISVKNGGDEFLAEVGTREFIDNLVSILQIPLAGGTLNPDVKQRILALLQSWAQISEVRPGYMDHAATVVKQLRADGYDFPPKDPVDSVVSSSAAAFETRTMPDWVDGEVCLRCRTPFTTFTRKHHCRNCGNVFCHQCSSHTMALPWFGVGQPVRVCDGCFARKSIPPKAAIVRRKSVDSPRSPPAYGRGGVGAANSPRHARSKTMDPRVAAARRKEEEDLQLAIKLSLQGSGEQSAVVPSAPSAPSMPGRQLEGTDESPLNIDTENDPDLAAAIKASLETAPPQVLAAQRAKSSITNEGLAPSAPDFAPPAPVAAPSAPIQASAPVAVSAATGPTLPSVEMDASDIDSLLTFVQSVSRLDQAIAIGQAPSQMSRPPPPVQAALEKSLCARPRLVRNLNEAESRLSRLNTMQAKLDYSVKLYDRLLDAQLAAAPPAPSFAPPTAAYALPAAGTPSYMPSYGYPVQGQPIPQVQTYNIAHAHAQAQAQAQAQAHVHAQAQAYPHPQAYPQGYLPPPAPVYAPELTPTSPAPDVAAAAHTLSTHERRKSIFPTSPTLAPAPTKTLPAYSSYLASTYDAPASPAVTNVASPPLSPSAPITVRSPSNSTSASLHRTPLTTTAAQTTTSPAPVQVQSPKAPSQVQPPNPAWQTPASPAGPYSQAAFPQPAAAGATPTQAPGGTWDPRVLHLPSAPSVPPATQNWLAGPESHVPAQAPKWPEPVAQSQPQAEVSLIEL